MEILERPLLVGFIGGALALVLCYVWMKTGRKSLLAVAAAVALLAIGMIIAERVIVTDRESIETTLHEIADLVETNQFDAALDYLHPSASRLRRKTEAEIQGVTFQRAEIKHNLRIEVNQSARPKTAEATFNAVIEADVPGGLMRGPKPGFVTVQLQLAGDRWQVTDFDYDTPMRGFQRSSGTSN